MATEAIDWKPEFFSIVHIALVDPDDPEKGVEPRVLSEGKGFPDADESFVDYLDFQIRKLLEKKADTAASSACKVYSFLEGEKGEEDRQLLEDRLLMTVDLKGFRAGAAELVDRIMAMQGLEAGLVVVMRSLVTVDEGAAGGNYLTAFWADFEDASRFETAGALALEDVPDVLLRKLSRGFLYPYSDGRELRHDQLKLHSRPASHPFVEMLAIEAPPTTEQLMQREVARAIYSRDRDAKTRYRNYFEKVPPKKRELFGEERYVKVGDLLPERDAAAVAREASRTTRDLYDKEQKLRIKIDGAVTVDVRIEDLGQSFFFAQDGGEKFLVIRGKSFQTSTAHLNSVDFMEIDGLDDVIERMRS